MCVLIEGATFRKLTSVSTQGGKSANRHFRKIVIYVQLSIYTLPQPFHVLIESATFSGFFLKTTYISPKRHFFEKYVF